MGQPRAQGKAEVVKAFLPDAVAVFNPPHQFSHTGQVTTRATAARLQWCRLGAASPLFSKQHVLFIWTQFPSLRELAVNYLC